MTQATQKTPPGYKQTEIGVIPEDWDMKKLDDCLVLLTDFEANGSFESVANNVNVYDSENFAWYVRATDLENKSDVSDVKYIDEKSYKFLSKTKLFGDEVLITKRGEIGKVYFFKMKTQHASVAPNMYLLKLNDLVVPFYIYNFFKSAWGKKGLLNKNASTTLGALYKNDVKNILIPLPPTTSEQTAIAAVLSDAAALIEKLEKLIAKKKAIKQGAMQQLLTGKKRLPGFCGKWEVKKLGEVCDIQRGQLITESARIDGSIPVIAGGKTPAYYHNKANRHGKTITISGSGASAGYVAFHEYPIFASDCSTIEESRSYSIKYIYFLLQSIQDKIYKMQTGGAQPHIHPNDLNPIVSFFPQEEEQTAIAAVLSNIDAEIGALEKSLTKYQHIKTGMMQQLLTGKIRLIEKTL